MPPQRIYRSKVDGKIAFIIGLSLVVLVVAGVTVPDQRHGTALALQAVFLLCLALCVWTLLGTYYVIDATVLVAHSGPFHWTVPLREIRSVRSTRDVRSGPALSFDRLRIEFGNPPRVLLVSPRHKDEFLADLVSRGVQGVER
jgi:Bacterial PH domain